MNRKIATLVVALLVFAMLGVIAWNEYSAGRLGFKGPGGTREGGLGFGITVSTSPGVSSLATRTHVHQSTRTTSYPGSPSQSPPGTHALTLTSTPTPASTPTPIQTSSPTAETPTLLQVAAQFGVNLRDTPAGDVIQGLPEGTLVQAYPEKEIRAAGFSWRRVVTLDGVEGWLAVDHLIPFSGTLTMTP